MEPDWVKLYAHSSESLVQLFRWSMSSNPQAQSFERRVNFLSSPCSSVDRNKPKPRVMSRIPVADDVG